MLRPQPEIYASCSSMGQPRGCCGQACPMPCALSMQLSHPLRAAGRGQVDFGFSASTSHYLAPDWVSLNNVMCGGLGFLAASLPPSPPAPQSPPSPPSISQARLPGTCPCLAVCEC